MNTTHFAIHPCKDMWPVKIVLKLVHTCKIVKYFLFIPFTHALGLMHIMYIYFMRTKIPNTGTVYALL